MANLLQSAQTKTTEAPDYYKNYLSGLASSATSMMPGGENAPQYVGAQPLQEQAFSQVAQNAGAYQPSVQAGQQLVGQSGAQDISGAGAGYLAAGTAINPLAAFAPLAGQAVGTSPAELAAQYMNPFINTAVQSMSDIAQRNIRQNLSPAATAAAVGSGQFGSQRGAQVLGQIQAQAEQDLNKNISDMLGQGYGQALTAAGQRQQLLGQLGSTASTAQNSYNQSLLQAGQTSGTQAAQQAEAERQAGLGLGTLGAQGQQMSLADINALSTLGGQQQTIAQNRQMFPLTTLSNLSGIMQGQAVPTGTKTTLDMSPLSALGTVGSGALGLMTPKYDKNGNVIPNSSPLDILKGIFKGDQKSNPNLPDPSKVHLPEEQGGFPINEGADPAGTPVDDQGNLNPGWVMDDTGNYVYKGYQNSNPNLPDPSEVTLPEKQGGVPIYDGFDPVYSGQDGFIDTGYSGQDGWSYPESVI
jgi:hypothetical protein